MLAAYLVVSNAKLRTIKIFRNINSSQVIAAQIIFCSSTIPRRLRLSGNQAKTGQWPLPVQAEEEFALRFFQLPKEDPYYEATIRVVAAISCSSAHTPLAGRKIFFYRSEQTNRTFR
jgi:hypothetical protein